MNLMILLIMLLLLLLAIITTHGRVVPTTPSYRKTGTHQNTASLCAENRLRMPACNFDRDVDDVISHFSLHRPPEEVRVWCYERSSNRCRAIIINPSLAVIVPDRTWDDCEDPNYQSICLNVPREGPE